jgi:hypothetical protein
MVQPKYSPEEALQRVKLMMGYDLKKSLREDVKEIGIDLNEQSVVGAPNYGVTKTDSQQQQLSPEQSIADAIYKAAAGFGTDEDGMIVAIEKIANSKQFWNINSYLKTIGDKLNFAGIVNDEMDNEDGKYVQRIIDHLKKIGIDSTANINEYGNFRPNSFKITSTGVSNNFKKNTSLYKPCQGGKYVRGCKSDVVKKIQICLGMPLKYQTGNFGPITQGNLQKLGKGYENGFTDADVDKICSGTEEKLGSDVESQTLGQDQNAQNTNTGSNTNPQDSTTKTGIS